MIHTERVEEFLSVDKLTVRLSCDCRPQQHRLEYDVDVRLVVSGGKHAMARAWHEGVREMARAGCEDACRELQLPPPPPMVGEYEVIDVYRMR